MDDRWKPRRRKCRRPKFQTADGALAFAVLQLGERGRTAYLCTAHVPPMYHLHPKGHERTA